MPSAWVRRRLWSTPDGCEVEQHLPPFPFSGEGLGEREQVADIGAVAALGAEIVESEVARLVVGGEDERARVRRVPASETDATTAAAARSVRARAILSFMAGLPVVGVVTPFDARHARHGCRRPGEGLRSIRGSICSRSISILRWTRPLEWWASVLVCRAFRFRGDDLLDGLVIARSRSGSRSRSGPPRLRAIDVWSSLCHSPSRSRCSCATGSLSPPASARSPPSGSGPDSRRTITARARRTSSARCLPSGSPGLTTDWRAAAAGLASGLLLVAYDESVLPGGGFGDFLFSAVILTGVWVAASALAHRGRHARTLQLDLAAAQAEREERARQAVTAERTRIARELHDVIAHNLSVAIVQLTAALPDLHEDGETTRRVQAAETSCRQALDEMRRLLGVLRTDESEPELAPVTGPRLRRRTRRTDEGRRPRPGARPSRERRHSRSRESISPPTASSRRRSRTPSSTAPERPTSRCTTDGMRSRSKPSTNDATANPRPNGSGRGLVGMRERAALYGGSLDAGPDANGGYRVAARLPLEPARD